LKEEEEEEEEDQKAVAIEKREGKPSHRVSSHVKSLKGHYHQDWNFQVVKTGDKLGLGPPTC
jgi:hypothetical protein